MNQNFPAMLAQLDQIRAMNAEWMLEEILRSQSEAVAVQMYFAAKDSRAARALTDEQLDCILRFAKLGIMIAMADAHQAAEIEE